MAGVLDRNQLRGRLRQGPLDPVYVLFGRETYLRDLAARAIRKSAFGEGDFVDFNDDVFSLSSPENLRTALAAAEQLPMMATRRVVTVTDVRVANTAASDTLKEEYVEDLSRYLDSPSPSTVLIFVADDLNATRKLGKLLREKAVSVEFAILKDKDFEEWAYERVADQGLELDGRSLRYLLSLVGPDPRRFTQELKKLATAALPGSVINMDLIDELVSNSSETSNFDLTKYLMKGDRPNALRALKKILDDGGEPVALLGLISYNFRMLLGVKEMIDRNVERGEVARVMRLRPWDQQEVFTAARRAERKSLIKVLGRLAETDLAIKTSVGGPSPKGSRLQLEMLVCELAGAL